MKNIQVGILVLALLAACTPAPMTVTDVPASATTIATLPEPATATLTPVPGPERYINEEGGFSLELPSDWSVVGPLEVNNRLDRPYNLYLLGTDPEPSGGPGTSKIVIANAALWTAEDFVFSQCSTCLDHPFEEVSLGGLPARRTQIGGDGVPFTVTWYFVVDNDQLIALAIHDEETLVPLEEVIESIRFKEEFRRLP